MGGNLPSASSRIEDDTTRRRLLTLMGAGGAAALATLVSSKEAHAGHDSTNVMHLGESNSAPDGAQTKLLANVGSEDVDPGVALIVESTNSAFGGAITGTWHGPGTGHGVSGFNHSPGTPEGGSGPGVQGASDNDVGVIGFGGAQAGVRGLSNNGDGVLGQAGSAEGEGGPSVAGVRGEALGCVEKGPCGPGIGIGVFGRSEAGIGVKAKVDDPAGFALDVAGKARFSTAGSAVIPNGQNSVFVSDASVTDDSHISVTLVGNPGGMRAVQWVDRAPGSGFTVRLTPTGQKPETPLTYFVVEPASA
jgi:hypothetical protein